MQGLARNAQASGEGANRHVQMRQNIFAQNGAGMSRFRTA
jgi:hypothetical protein